MRRTSPAAQAATLPRKVSISRRRLSTAPSTDFEADSTTSAEVRVATAASATSPSTATIFAGLLRGVGDVVGDVERRRALLLDRARDRRGVGADLLDAFLDAADRVNRALGGGLHRRNLLGDVLGRLAGLQRERFHLGGDHREAAAGFAGARRLDGGVEREQIGLAGDLLDQIDDVADLLRRIGQSGEFVVGRRAPCSRRRARSWWSARPAARSRWRTVDICRVATAAFSTLVEAPCDACRMPLARCEVCSDEPNSLVAVDFIVLVQSPTVVSTLSTRWRNDAMAESTESRCACSVTSSWVATQPPPGIGARTTLIRRPSVELVDPARKRVGRVLASGFDTVPAPTSPGCRWRCGA